MATGPKLASSPLELLTNDGSRPAPYIYKYWGPIIGGTFGLVASVLANWGRRRPLMSGVQVHALMTVAGAALGQLADDYRADYLAERDAVFRHYIELHPEDFPAFDRKKFADVIEKWVPIR